ncbi:MAG: cytochrome P450 [Sciscionella sp.]|nr:cytochrome P450 [Sciscionella sp.]
MTQTAHRDFAALLDPATRANPYPVLDGMRETGPFQLFDGALTMIGEYAQCMRMLRDPSVSSERFRSLMTQARGVDPQQRDGISFLSLDPPDHTRLRRLVSKAFTPRVIAAQRPRIVETVDQRLTEAAEAGSIDVVSGLAYPLPVRIISELLGVPPDDRHRIEAWSRRLVRALDPALSVTDPQASADGLLAGDEFREYFRGLIADRRRRPGEDLLTRLVQIEESGDQLTEPELLATCTLLLVAGHETTANLIANGVLALLRNPDQLALLRAHPELVAGAVEEALRYDPPVQMTTRVARTPRSVGSVTAPADGMLVLLIAAANRDPAQFDRPAEFDITRERNQHLAFAAGAHFCLGAALARLEASVAFTQFAGRVVAPVLDEQSLSYRPHVNLRGPDRCTVGFADLRPLS